MFERPDPKKFSYIELIQERGELFFQFSNQINFEVFFYILKSVGQQVPKNIKGSIDLIYL